MPVEFVSGLENCICRHIDLINLYGCDIGQGTKIGAFVEIGEGVRIGKGCKIQSFVYIPPGTIIGDKVFIGPGVMFTNCKRPDLEKTPVLDGATVEDGVVIGASSVILPGVRIGKGAFIAAGSVITKNVNAGDTVIQKRCACK